MLIWSTTTAEKKLDFAARKNNFAVVDQAITTQALFGGWFYSDPRKQKSYSKGKNFWSEERSDEWRK